MSKFNLDYKPIEFVRTDNLTREQWLAYRKKGIGGSDAAAAMYLSPFQTCRELYYDKISDVLEPESEYVSNWVQFKFGNLLEDLVAEIFAKQTGYKVFKVKIMIWPWKLV